MSRFVRCSGLVALGLLGAADLARPALADASPLRTGDRCLQSSSRSLAACRIGAKSARRHVTRTAMAEVPPSIFGEPIVPVASRYVSLLILGVGF